MIRYYKIIGGVLNNKIWRINLSVTNRCNSRCMICNVWKNSKFDELTVDEYHMLFKNIGDNLRWLHITGGEPFIRNDITDIISSAAESCPNIAVIDIATNGFLTNDIYQAMEKLIKKYPSIFFEVGISIDGRPDIHEHIRNVKGCWKNINNTWNLLKNLSLIYKNFRVHANFTITPWNIGEIKYFLGEYPLFSPISVSIYHIGSSFKNIDNDISPDFYEDLKEDISWLINNGKTTGIVKKLFLRLSLRYLDNPSKQILPCEAGSSSFFLDPQGDVYVCSISNYKLGNIRKDPELIFLNNDDNKELKNDIHNGMCSCWSGCECWTSILRHMPMAFIKAL